jgi:hypothetical protein
VVHYYTLVGGGGGVACLNQLNSLLSLEHSCTLHGSQSIQNDGGGAQVLQTDRQYKKVGSKEPKMHYERDVHF